jgi:hypothetical protein
MSSRHRFLERSINHVSLHNRLTEEDAMWRRRDQEQGEVDHHQQQQHPSRSSYEKRKSSSRKHRSSSEEDDKTEVKNHIEADFGPPLPSNLGVNADRWDHAFFMERYPKEYEKQINKLKRKDSTSSEDEKKKKKHSKHHRHRRRDDDSKKKNKRKHRSRS